MKENNVTLSQLNSKMTGVSKNSKCVLKAVSHSSSKTYHRRLSIVEFYRKPVHINLLHTKV